MRNKNIDTLNKQEYDITLNISKVTRHVYNGSAYNSRNAEFRWMSFWFKFTVPSFIHQRINTEQLYEQFGSLLGSHLITECDSALHNSVAMPSSSEKPILCGAQIITTLNTRYESLNHVTCFSDNKVWTQGNSNIMKLYDLKGNLQQSIKTKSWNTPYDIAMTNDGNLVYIDYKDKTMNRVKKTRVQKVSRSLRCRRNT